VIILRFRPLRAVIKETAIRSSNEKELDNHGSSAKYTYRSVYTFCVFDEASIAMAAGQNQAPIRSATTFSLDNSHLLTFLDENDTKVRILLAAARLFADRGYAGTSVREIVAMAGVTKPTLYYYFKNKDDLCIKLMDLAMETYAKVLKEPLQQPGTVRRRLASLFASLYAILRANTDFLRFSYWAFYAPQGSIPPYDLTVANDYLRTTLEEILQDGVAAEELSAEKVESVMLLLVGLMRNMEELLAVNPTDPGLTPADLAAAIDLILDGARAPQGGDRP